ncbi:MAG: hypothetical protein WCC63_01890 [Candidatus Bathyarchaeia archaeon]
MINKTTVQQKNTCLKMKCPYLSSASKKECVKMLAESIGGELSEFDLKHFCDGNPVYCYYFRVPAARTTTRLQKTDLEPETTPCETPLLRKLSLDAQVKTDKPLRL